MKKSILSLILLFITSVSLLLASMNSEVSFPKLKGWKLNVSSDVYIPDNLWDLINGAAESYLSYDFVDLHLADYENKMGTEIHAEIYRHSSFDNAFGIYSSERSPDYNFLEIGTQGYLDEGILNFFTGRYYVKLYTTSSADGLQESLENIGTAISAHLGQVGGWPNILSAFPEEGRLANQEHFIGENFIGFDFLHSAFTVEYEGDYKLFVIKGENRDEVMDMIRAYLKFTKQSIDPESEPNFIITDKYNGNIPVIIKGSYIAGIIDGAENQDALDNLESLIENLKE